MKRADFEKGLIWEKSQGRCYYCGKTLNPFFGEFHIDHVIPVTRGGTHHIDNLVPCCLPCNSHKGDKTLDELRALPNGVPFWFEREGLAIAHTPPEIPPGWYASTLAPVVPDRRTRRVIAVLEKRGDLNMSSLQKACSPYGIRKATLLVIVDRLAHEGQLHRYRVGRAERLRWTP